MENSPKGISNLGNTCYLNACIQIFSQIDLLYKAILKTRSLNSTKPEIQLWNQWKEIQFVMTSASPSGEVLCPNGFLSCVQTLSKQKNRPFLLEKTQEDVTEFLTFFIECLHNCIARTMSIRVSGHSENETDNLAIVVYGMLKKEYEKDYSEMVDLFSGVYVSYIDGLESPHTNHSMTPEIYYVLNLSVNVSTPETPQDLYNCLDEFCKAETLDGDNSWYNEKTKQKEAISKYIRFWSFPKVLIISLKRTDMYGQKINAKIDFPCTLDLRKYGYGYKKTDNIFELRGICNHHGNHDDGHYTSFVKKADMWYFCNDEKVQAVNDEKLIVTPFAYVLFYVKKNADI